MREVQLLKDRFPHSDNSRLLAKMSFQSSAPQTSMHWGSRKIQISFCGPGEGPEMLLLTISPVMPVLSVPG